MQAIGMIETQGLLAAIEATDAMLKAAEVHLLERSFVRGGLVCITVTGDVAACQASVDAGVAAVERLGYGLLVSQHIIPRPAASLALLFSPSSTDDGGDDEPTPPSGDADAPPINPIPPQQKATPKKNSDAVETSGINENYRKMDLDAIVAEKGLEEALSYLKTVKVVDLRNIAREYDDFAILGREISKANKALLLENFARYYSNDNL